MKMLWNKCKDLYKKELPLSIEWAVVITVLTVSYFTMYYTDISITYEHGLNLLECIFSGNFFGFYDYAATNSSFNYAAYYELPVYAVFAVWGLPVFILNKLFAVSIHAVGVRLWFKLIPVLAIFISSRILGMIVEALKIDLKMKKWIQLLFLSSLAVVIPVFQVAQYDSMYLILILLGLYHYIKGNHKYFILFFAIAAPMKLFSLMILIPLLLLKEKRILYIIRDMAISVSLLLLCKLLFHNSVAYGYINAFVTSMSDMLKFSPISVANNAAVFFYTGFALICIWAYNTSLDEVKDRNSYILYIPMAAMLNFFVFTTTFPYWIVLLVPFMLLVMFYNSAKIKINMILELILTLAFIYINTISFSFVYGSHNVFTYLVLSQSKWVEARMALNNLSSAGNMINAFGLGSLGVMAASFILACAIGLLYVNYPRRDTTLKTETVNLERGMVWLRLLALAGWTGFVFIAVL